MVGESKDAEERIHAAKLKGREHENLLRGPGHTRKCGGRRGEGQEISPLGQPPHLAGDHSPLRASTRNRIRKRG